MDQQAWMQQRLSIRKENNHRISYRSWLTGEEMVKPVFFHLYENILTIIPYGTPQRVYHQILFYTGCLPTETKNMDILNLTDNIFWWERGKGQGGWRHIWLPQDFIEEIKYMMKHHGSRGTLIFSKHPESFRRDFNMFWRPRLCDEWNQKLKLPEGMKKKKGQWKYFAEPFVFNFKGYRKGWTTIRLCQRYLEYHDWSISMGQVRRDLGHASKLMTEEHYVACAFEMGAMEYAKQHPLVMKALDGQLRINSFFNNSVVDNKINSVWVCINQNKNIILS